MTPAQSGAGRVLFVDDELAARRTFRRMIESRGFDVDEAGCAAEAISMAAENSYAVVATDLNMPGMSGIELIEKLQSISPSSSFILVTERVELNLPTPSGRPAAITCIVQKPADTDELAIALERGCALHRERAAVLKNVGPKQRGTTMHVLLVDDSHDDATLVRQMLAGGSSTSYSVTNVRRLSDALAAIKEIRFDILLVDLILPDARGLDVIAALQPAAPSTPIVAMTGLEDEEIGVQAVRIGAQDYLLKGDVGRSNLRRSLRYALERQASQARLSKLAHHDPLTGLANRILFRESAMRALRRAKRQRTHPAILVLDLDRFKVVNDTLGHEAGDAMLVKVAERLEAAVRNTDTVARLGGDEFAILIEDVNAEEEHSLPAQRILDSLAVPVTIGGNDVVATTSIGIAVYPESGETVEEMLRSADLAMYRAKDAGRNSYQFFDKALHAVALEKMEIERELRGALERDEFELYYQPQNRIGDDKIVSLEALVRWNHPRHGQIQPDRFIGLLEELGHIVAVGEWVLQQACHQIRLWQHRFDADLRVAVNVSARQFDDPHLVRKVEGALTAAGVCPSRLELEITEGLLMIDLDSAVRTLHELKALGVRIAIDDFGTGYSRLAYLTRFPIDVLKIDRSVIDTIGGDEGDTIATAVIELGHTLGFEVVAEGVEELKQLDFLRNHDCDLFQGFISSRPLNVEACSAWLDESERRLRPAKTAPLAE